MKEFIYLDTPFLHSFIAQKNSGLPTTHSTEFQESESTSDIIGKSNELQNGLDATFKSGDLKIPGIFSTPSGTLGYKIGHKKTTNSAITLTQLEAGKEIISKQLHDDALQQFEDYLEENKIIKDINLSDTLSNGEFIRLRGPFSIFDINHLKNALNPEGLITAMEFALFATLAAEKKKIEATAKNQNEINSKVKQIEKTHENQIKEFKVQFTSFKTIIEYIESLLPSSSFIKIGDVICPLKTDYLRERSSDLSFKYGVNQSIPITVIGKYTRTFNQYIQMSGAFNPIGDILNSFEDVFEQLGIIKKGDRIVSPIAIYFE